MLATHGSEAHISLYIHYLISQYKEASRLQWLSKKIGMIVHRGNIWDDQASFLDKFSYEIVTSVYVLGPGMVLWIVR